MRAIRGFYHIHLVPWVRRLILLLVFCVAVIAALQLTPPDWLSRIAPRWPATVVIGGVPHYFPLGFVTPHYTNWHSISGTGWLTVDTMDFHLLPRDQAASLNPFARIDVIVSSMTVPSVRKHLDAARSGKGFAKGPHGFEKRAVGDAVQYRAKGVSVSCDRAHCSLLAARDGDRAIYAFFPESVLPRWRDLLTRVEAQMAGCARRPAMMIRIRRALPNAPPARALCPWDGVARNDDALAALDPLWWRDLRRKAGF